MSNTKPSHVTADESEASDKDGRDTLVTKRAGQVSSSIRRSRAVITSSCHASLRAGSGCVRVGWHTRENKMKLFIQV